MLVVVALDGADPGFLRRNMGRGTMPALAQLAARGVTIPLGGPELELEHGAWHALLSGRRRARDGHHHYRELVPGTYELAAPAEPDLQGTVLGAAARAGRRVLACDLPGIAVSAKVAATQLQGWGSIWGAPPACHPPELLGQVAVSAGPPTRILETGRPSSATEDAEIAERARAHLKRRAALHRHLMVDRPDFAVLAIQELHLAGHQLWRHHQRYADGAPELAGVLDDIYHDADAVLAALLELAGPAADVMVLASVGLAAQWPVTDLFDAVLTDLGYRTPSPARGRRPIDIVRRLFPEATRIAISRRFPRGLRERLLADGWTRRTDWAQTAAFAIPSEYTGYLRVNLRGREPDGTVEPGAEYHALLDRLTEDLLAVHAPEIDGPLVERVIRTCELFETGGPPWRLPDLLVRVTPSEQLIRRVEHRRGATTVRSPEFLRSSHHDGTAVLVAAGPSVASAGELPARDALDVAPTLHALLAVPVEEVLPGRTIDALLA